MGSKYKNKHFIIKAKSCVPFKFLLPLNLLTPALLVYLSVVFSSDFNLAARILEAKDSSEIQVEFDSTIDLFGVG